MKRLLAAFGSGLLFSVGLAVSRMTQPQKVVAFLDVGGDWDPSLALVLLAALAVYAPGYLWLRRRRRAPVLEARFFVPPPRAIDRSLIAGAVLFGVGWGLGGLCPGPAIVSLGALAPSALLVVPSMLVGALVVRRLRQRREPLAEDAQVCG